jgi:DNA-directed RNA polymerase specialized sigma24 family protein
LRIRLRDGKGSPESAGIEPSPLDLALSALEASEPDLRCIVACRFIAGLTLEQTARALDGSPRMVRRGWSRAKALIREALEESRKV